MPLDGLGMEATGSKTRQRRGGSLQVRDRELPIPQVRKGPRSWPRGCRTGTWWWAAATIAGSGLLTSCIPDATRYVDVPVTGNGVQNGSLGNCPVFPADNAWNRDVSTLPVATNLGEVPRRHRRARRQPEAARRLRRRRRLRDPVHDRPRQAGDGAGQLRRLRRRERPGPVPDPAHRAGRRRRATATCSPSTATTASSTSCSRDRARRPLGRELRRECSTSAPTRCVPTGWTSADAAGLPIFPGLVRYDEVAGGHIDHALRFTVSRARNAASSSPPRTTRRRAPIPTARRWACASG